MSDEQLREDVARLEAIIEVHEQKGSFRNADALRRILDHVSAPSEGMPPEPEKAGGRGTDFDGPDSPVVTTANPSRTPDAWAVLVDGRLASPERFVAVRSAGMANTISLGSAAVAPLYLHPPTGDEK